MSDLLGGFLLLVGTIAAGVWASAAQDAYARPRAAWAQAEQIRQPDERCGEQRVEPKVNGVIAALRRAANGAEGCDFLLVDALPNGSNHVA